MTASAMDFSGAPAASLPEGVSFAVSDESMGTIGEAAVSGSTRDDHRALMDGMIKLYAQYKESLEKKSMGFAMSSWDDKLLKYGQLFESKLMDLSVNIPLEKALDLGWEILAECFEPNETGLKTSLIKERWPKKLDE